MNVHVDTFDFNAQICLFYGLIIAQDNHNYSGFLPQSINIPVRRVGNGKLAMGVIASMNGCVSFSVGLLHPGLVQVVALPATGIGFSRSLQT